jgi:hypothetical protein
MQVARSWSAHSYCAGCCRAYSSALCSRRLHNPLRLARAAPSPPGFSTISGRITEQGSDRPLPGALVILGGLDGSQKQRTFSDAQGRYELTGIPSGEYILWATAGEHRSTHLSQAFGEPAPMEPSSRPRPSLELQSGERRTDLNIALARALAIEGRLLDLSDDPMANVAIQLKRVDGKPSLGPQVYSNDRGEFRLYGLRPQRYRVCVAPETRFVPSSDGARFIRTCYPAATSESSAAEIALTDSDVTGIEIRVQRTGTFSISGTVEDASGDLVDGAWVTAWSVEGDKHIGSSSLTRSGQFDVPGLPPGAYIVSASIGGQPDPAGTRPAVRQREMGFSKIELGNADAADVTIRLFKGATIQGRVVFEGDDAPRVRPRQLEVQAGAASNLGRVSGRPAAAVVDDKLNFELSDIVRLPATVHLTGLPAGWIVKAVRYGQRDITDAAIDFGADPEPSRLEILVTKAPANPVVR